MKLSLSPLLSAFALGVCASSALAQQTPAAPVAPPATPTELGRRVVTLPAQGLSRDDDLIALGRAAGINLFADSSQWPADTPALSGPRTGSPFALLGAENTRVGDATPPAGAPQPLAARPLSWLGQGDSLLIWTRPDMIALARRIAAGETIRRIALPPAPVSALAPVAPPAPFVPKGTRFEGLDIQALLDAARAAQEVEPQRWQVRWNEYLAQLPGGGAAGATRDIPVRDLPPDLRAYVLAQAQSSLLPDNLMAHWKAWMTDEFWQTARLSIRDMDTLVAGQTLADPPQKKVISMLFISNALQVVPGRRGNTMMSIANLGEAPAKTP